MIPIEQTKLIKLGIGIMELSKPKIKLNPQSETIAKTTKMMILGVCSRLDILSSKLFPIIYN